MTPEAHERLKARLKMRLADVYDDKANGDRVAQREQLTEQLHRMMRSVSEELRVPALGAEEEQRLCTEVIDEVVGIGPLEGLLSDPGISEIMVNGPHQLYVERGGKIEQLPPTVRFRDQQHLRTVIERLLQPAGVTVNEAEPCVDASLPDGSRVNVVLPPIAPEGPAITIRKAVQRFSMEDWVGFGSISAQAAQFLEAAVKAHLNLVISGGTSSGKTTLVSILARYMRADERVITIENVAELELPSAHWVRLVARPSNAEGRGEISLRHLVKNALRMRPDRLILGEARGGEALDVVQAMLTGHDGVITVLHGNAPQAALERLQTLMLMSGLDLPADACRRQVASAVQLVIHLSHFPDGSRRVERIVQVAGAGAEGFVLEDLFVFHWQEGQVGALQATGAKPRFAQRFLAHNVQLPEGLFKHG